VKGAVTLRLRTDSPELRFHKDAIFKVTGGAPNLPARLSLRSYNQSPGGAVAAFAEISDRNTAELLRGAELVAEVSPEEEAEAWYPEQLRGAAVELEDGTPVGEVQDLVNGPAQDWLEIRQPDGTTALVPLVKQLVPIVDLAAGRIVIDPPAGLVAARPDDAE
jgi:16S rRNA processing protein RimM